jgi:hypothetical protein
MAATGTRFLKLSGAEDFLVSLHALERLREHSGRPVAEEEAFAVFGGGMQVSAEKLILMGYRPAYGRRMSEDKRSWYFRFEMDGQEMIAVVGEGDRAGQYIWVTTYVRNRQTAHLMVAAFDMLMSAA